MYCDVESILYKSHSEILFVFVSNERVLNEYIRVLSLYYLSQVLCFLTECGLSMAN